MNHKKRSKFPTQKIAEIAEIAKIAMLASAFALMAACAGGEKEDRRSYDKTNVDGKADAMGGCSDSCSYAGDGECDDGGEGSDYNVCDFGSDCSDCGTREAPDGDAGCLNTCRFAGDDECDDGGEGSDYSVCAYGTDCMDCGSRGEVDPPDICTPTTCEDESWNCGVAQDGCGGLMECGTCTAPGVCGGAGVPHVCSCQSGTWSQKIIDPTRGASAGMTMDRNGGLHIAYYKQGYDYGDLRYAYLPPNGVWSTSELDDATGEVGREPTIVVDSSLGVHVAYIDGEEGELKYAHRPEGGQWSFGTIDSNSVSKWGKVDIALDSLGTVHVAYTRRFSAHHAELPASGGWRLSTISESAHSESDISIAVDNVAGVHVSFQDSYKLRYAHRAPGLPWTVAIVEEDAGKFSAIAVDAANTPHIAYYAKYKRLKYARLGADASWSKAMIDASEWSGFSPDIAVDANNNVHMSYVNWDEYEVRYALRGAGGGLSVEVVDDSYATLKDTALVLDDAGGVHLSFTHLDNHDSLRYAYRCP